MFTYEFYEISCPLFFTDHLVAASENLRDVFVQQFFSLQLKLCLYLIYSRSSENVLEYLF